MKNLVPAFAVVLLLASPFTQAEETKGKAPAPAMSEPVFVNPADLKWGPAPPGLPKGAQLVVLHGDPTKSGPFTMRLKMPDGYKIPPHWHTMDEQLTILSGTFILHMGDSMDVPGHQLVLGGYHFLPRKMHHAAEVKGETVVQVHGMGPFDIHYLNPQDDPRKAAK